MHLLVLSAFRHTDWYCQCSDFTCLNAPFGAQCFPTGNYVIDVHQRSVVSMHLLVLSAFRPKVKSLFRDCLSVSMHLLVLSAFRRGEPGPKGDTPQVSMHLLVLSAFRQI